MENWQKTMIEEVFAQLEWLKTGENPACRTRICLSVVSTTKIKSRGETDHELLFSCGLVQGTE
jgi:hypothetical protein